MRIYQLRQWSLGSLLLLLSFVTACGSPTSQKKLATSARVSPTYQGPDEASYCSTALTAYADTVTITGKAVYLARQIVLSGTNRGLGAPGAPQPIRRAEVRVTDSSGNTVQCATTDGDGQFSLTLPRGNGTLRLAVNSRANNSYLKASILNAPEQNQLYSLTHSLQPTADQNIGTLTAGAIGDVLGGAFNILDQLLKANDYLRSQASNCSQSFSGCYDFTVAPKVNVYWEKGFNPGTYYNPYDIGLSYYLPGYKRLFILGGLNGDVDRSDTDHFDNSIIIHEYGHFLEDVLIGSDSPGGSHNGDKIIDPRLAWSEGWGNFLQAAVLGSPYYVDTMGNIDGDTDLIFEVDLENQALGSDVPREAGEGNFREFSVTRFMWDIVDGTSGSAEANGAADDIDDSFPRLWAALTHPSSFRSPQLAFRSVGLLHSTQSSLKAPNGTSAAEDWSNIETIEFHQGDRSNYANYVHADPSCKDHTFSITPYNDPLDSGRFDTSNLLRNNDFYHIKHNPSGGKGDLTLTLTYTTAGTYEADLDLYLYKGDARFGYQDYWAGYSNTQNDGDPNTSQIESFTISNLESGDYLINVMVWTGDSIRSAPVEDKYGEEAIYSLKTGGLYICPTSGP